MIKRMISSLMALALVALPLLAAGDKKETGRLENCGLIVKEVMAGPWSAPTMMALEGGSVGLQLGGQATDFVLLVMNPRGARAILGNKVKLGADASAAAGPKGRTANASTDVTMRAEVLSYSRARGLFAGLSLEGSTVRPDNDANERIYGKKLEAESIVFKGAVAVPPSAQKLIAYLNQKSPKNTSDPESLK